jgi:methionyl-tRNA formyltransferase
MGNLDPLPSPILLLGTTGVMTQAVLGRLLAAGAAVSALALAGPPELDPQPLPPPLPAAGELPVLGAALQPNAVSLAWQAEIPVYRLGRLDRPAAAAWLAAQGAAVGIVACFPRRIPPAWLAQPPLGWLNVHPSLLPAYRGPAPLFWQLRDGTRHTGVTVHFLDAILDTGDLARQQAVALPDGATGPALDRLLGTAGGDLLVETLAALAAGSQPRTPQPPGGSAQPWPIPADFALDPGWTARRSFNFLRGTGEWGRPYTLQAGGRIYRLQTALGWDAAGVLPAPVVSARDGVLQVQFTPGTVTVTVTPLLRSLSWAAGA